MLQKVVLFWFRRDLRLHDNAGLYAALSSGLPVVPLFIFDKEILNRLEDRNDRRVSFIYTALQKMQEQLVRQGATLCAEYGASETIFQQLLERFNIQAVYTNHDYEPYAIERDDAIGKLLQSKGVAFYTYKDQVIFERNEVVKGDGSGYIVYTPYSKRWKSLLSERCYVPLKVKAFFTNFINRLLSISLFRRDGF
jgi:deoxyribodipyrimidine photo-lyase